MNKNNLKEKSINAETTIKRTTLCYLEKQGRILMLFRNKKINDPCEGKWVGIGGKFEPGENEEQCMKREVFEETGLKVTKAHIHGIIHFISDELEDEDMYLYSVSEWTGNDNFPSVEELFEFEEDRNGKLIVKKIKMPDDNMGKKENTDKVVQGRGKCNAIDCGQGTFSCNEGTLAWVRKEDVLKLNLWEGDKYFLKPLLEGEMVINMTCEYSGDRLVRYYLNGDF